MSLEFNKIVGQVRKMGNMIGEIDLVSLNESLQLAQGRFDNAPDLDVVREHIEWVRGTDISGYRGAGPLDGASAEDINATIDEPDLPPSATIIAVDGSQVYPDERAPVHYYLLNIGLFIYHHGGESTPQPETYPELFYHRKYVHDEYGQLIHNRLVDDRRTVREMWAISELAHEVKGEARPLVALYDNRLLFVPGSDRKENKDLMTDYRKSLVHLHDSGALLAGYIDNPIRSRRFIQLLYLLSLENEVEAKRHQKALSRGGDMEGLSDQQLFKKILKPGQRSAIMVQSSPQNKLFRNSFGESYEVAFFYLNVSEKLRRRGDHIVRVDIPMWVARDQRAVRELHAIVLSQCRMQGRNPYPYALTRADELAYIGAKDKLKLDQLVKAEIRRVQGEPAFNTLTPKALGKELARGDKRSFEIK